MNIWTVKYYTSKVHSATLHPTDVLAFSDNENHVLPFLFIAHFNRLVNRSSQ